MVEGLPVVDLAAGDGVAASGIDAAFREVGFCYLVGHDVDPALPGRLAALAAEFFRLPETEKARIAMAHGGRAWRGWFPLHGELTSGVPDDKEGLYFGSELDPDDPRVRAGRPLHGPNLFPEQPEGLRDAVLAYLDALTALGHRLVAVVAQGLGLPADWFARGWTADPVVLLRVFRYPPASAGAAGAVGAAGWGVAEHTDYGLLTLLWQDDTGGLEVRTPGEWVDAPPLPGSFVCNVGDMLDRTTGGRYRSTPHRVRNRGAGDRLAIPFFFDPGWDAEIEAIPLPGERPPDDAQTRWDGTSVHEASGTYGDYLLRKVARVFPDLSAAASDHDDAGAA